MPTAGEVFKKRGRSPDKTNQTQPSKKQSCNPKADAAVPKSKEAPFGKRVSSGKPGTPAPTEAQLKQQEIIKRVQEEQNERVLKAAQAKANKLAAEMANATPAPTTAPTPTPTPTPTTGPSMPIFPEQAEPGPSALARQTTTRTFSMRSMRLISPMMTKEVQLTCPLSGG